MAITTKKLIKAARRAAAWLVSRQTPDYCTWLLECAQELAVRE